MNDIKEKHATFTPGPWQYSTTYMGKSEVYIGSDDKTGGHCVVYSKNHYKDARLIAAAPELLEQCKLFEKVLNELVVMGEVDIEDRDKLREILAKVEGGEG